MTDNTAAKYRRLFTYEQDSHAKVLASLEATPRTLRADARFQKAVDLLAHLVAARRMWLHRFGQLENPPDELFPQQVPLDHLPAQLDEMHQEWMMYLHTLTDAELERVFTYRSYDGRSFRNSVDDVLAQLHGHSFYHRGQIALLLRQLGAEPAATDFIFWAREAL